MKAALYYWIIPPLILYSSLAVRLLLLELLVSKVYFLVLTYELPLKDLAFEVRTAALLLLLLLLLILLLMKIFC